MDAQDWDRIGDLLMQIRGKVDNLAPKTESGDFWRQYQLDLIAVLLVNTDRLAKMDNEGWL